MACERRLIDANALGIGRCNPDLLPFGNRPYAAGWNGVVNIIDSAPTVDAEEVVHGKWEDVQETDMYVPDMHFTITKTAETCSQCKVRTGFVGPKPYLLDKICPNCGARMDGGTDNGI